MPGIFIFKIYLWTLFQIRLILSPPPFLCEAWKNSALLQVSLLIRKNSVLKWALIIFSLHLYDLTATYLNSQLHNTANKVQAFFKKTTNLSANGEITLFILKTGVSSHFLLGGIRTNEILHCDIMFCICLNSTVLFMYLKIS